MSFSAIEQSEGSCTMPFGTKLVLRQCRHVLLLNSPDLNPLNCYVRSVIERASNKSRYLNVASREWVEN